ncbi:hypothetical protein, conserved [Eimeria necatrix]|uniref:Uncharacterized protein n=1 Tax=Eimeria necatrix TaxID=51315 RepID=U6MXI3_9EIME|nr:hypothetical protein, conserved [Eimeria necatrix]CDJ67733.1 hypothetical protein, conserved [Eimeria necatrix]
MSFYCTELASGMSTSPSPSQVSAGSNNSTDCFQDILSQQLSVDASMRDESLVPREALAYTPQPSEILKQEQMTALKQRLFCVFGSLGACVRRASHSFDFR